MKLITKLVVAVESALISSAYWLWNIANVNISYELRTSNNLIEPLMKEIELTSYPYQIFTVALLVVAGIVGVGWLIYKWKNRPKPMPQNHLEGFKVFSHGDDDFWTFSEEPNGEDEQ